MGPYGTNRSVSAVAAAEQETDALIQAARDTFPDWDVIEQWSGFLAVPKGTEIVQAITLDALVGKLRQKEDTK
jgi:hypothetical protein